MSTEIDFDKLDKQTTDKDFEQVNQIAPFWQFGGSPKEDGKPDPKNPSKPLKGVLIGSKVITVDGKESRIFLFATRETEYDILDNKGKPSGTKEKATEFAIGGKVIETALANEDGTLKNYGYLYKIEFTGTKPSSVRGRNDYKTYDIFLGIKVLDSK
jgi:hypothetical protein